MPTRWNLPPGEIYRRGLATDDLPMWTHREEGRRLPLRPMIGLLYDTLLYALVWGSTGSLVLFLWRRRRQRQRGFAVLPLSTAPTTRLGSY